MTTETQPAKPITATSVELAERVFRRLAATYCAEWHHAIAGTPVVDVKTAWAHELSGFLATRETMKSVAWALANLPERVPNAIAFRNLCRQAPVTPAALLDAPRADPARVAAELAKLGAVREVQSPTQPKAWAKRIISRHAGGEKMSPMVLAMARAATRYEAFYDVHGQAASATDVAALARVA
jgi:hypothetical protein